MAQQYDLTSAAGMQSYLQTDNDPPPVSINVERLAEGWSGFVYRARVVGDNNQTTSHIVKHVAGYAARHPEFKIGAERMDYEDKGLEFLGRPSTNTEILSVQVPQRVHYDRDNHVLIMQDAGDLPTLKSWLRADTPFMQILSVGRSLGSYLAHIHNMTADDSALKNDFRNAVGRTVSSSVYFDALPTAAETFGYTDTFIHEAASAAALEVLTADEVWTLGDFWTGNVLVSAPDEKCQPQLTVIDFELAKPGTAAFDIGHMGAEMLCLARFRHEHQGTMLFRTFLQAYKAHSKAKIDVAAVATRIAAHLFTMMPRPWMAEAGEARVKEVLEEAFDLLRMGWEKNSRALRCSVVKDLWE